MDFPRTPGASAPPAAPDSLSARLERASASFLHGAGTSLARVTGSLVAGASQDGGTPLVGGESAFSPPVGLFDSFVDLVPGGLFLGALGASGRGSGEDLRSGLGGPPSWARGRVRRPSLRRGDKRHRCSGTYRREQGPRRGPGPFCPLSLSRVSFRGRAPPSRSAGPSLWMGCRATLPTGRPARRRRSLCSSSTLTTGLWAPPG